MYDDIKDEIREYFNENTDIVVFKILYDEFLTDLADRIEARLASDYIFLRKEDVADFQHSAELICGAISEIEELANDVRYEAENLQTSFEGY